MFYADWYACLWCVGRCQGYGGQLQRDCQIVSSRGWEPGYWWGWGSWCVCDWWCDVGEQGDPGGGGQPGDAGPRLQHGQGGGEPHEARVRPQDLPHPQWLPQRQRGHFIQLENVQRYAGKNESWKKDYQMFIFSFQSSCDRNLTSLRDDLATDLFELEEEYYSSSFKWLKSRFNYQCVPI